MLNLRSIVPIAQRIECSPAKAEMKVRFLLGTPQRKLQVLGARLASLGGQFVLNFRGKNELAVLKEEKKKF